MLLEASVRYATRLFRSSPGFCCLVIVTLSLGIGATTAVFSFLYDAIIKPLPYPQPDRLVALYESPTPNDESNTDEVAPANFLDWQKQLATFDAIGASCGFTYNLTSGGVPHILYGVATSAGYMNVLRVKPQMGRFFNVEEDRAGANHVAVLSDRVWRRYFNADAAIVGRSIGLNGDSYVVIGVLPANWHTNEDDDYDVWIPLHQQVRPDRMLWRNIRYLRVIGRLKEGVTLEQARADLNRVTRSIKQSNAADGINEAGVVIPLQKALTRGMRSELYIAFGIVLVVLIVACANATNLMLVRIQQRSREVAIRTALGASRAQVVGQLLTESLVLASGSAAGGIVVALTGQKLLTRYAPNDTIFVGAGDLNVPVLCFALGLCLVTGIAFGVLPALSATRPAPQDVLRRNTTRSSEDRSAKRWMNAIAVTELSMAVALLVLAGLLVRSLIALGDTPVGFRTKDLIDITIQLPRIKYQQDRNVIAFAERVEERLKQVTGVEDVAEVEHLPLSGSTFATTFALAASDDHDHLPSARLRLVNARYLPLLSIPVIRGRNFLDLDQTDTQPVAIISESMARKFWPGQDPIGQSITPTRADVNGKIQTHVIIGVVGDVRDGINEDPEPTLYLPFSQMSFFTMRFVVQSHRSVGALDEELRRAVQSVDPNQPISAIRRMDDLLSESVAPWKFALWIEGTLGALALLLTLIGIFAVISYQVRQQSKEFGIRLALGASPRQILKAVLSRGVLLAIVGTTSGVVAGVFCARVLQSFIYGVKSSDPLTLVVVSTMMVLATVLACYLPARRASRIDPMAALREE